MITKDERVVLNWHCLDHVVARCPQCHEDLTGAQIGAYFIAPETDFCPACRADLTDALRLHILGCDAIMATLRERAEESRKLRKRSEELKTRSEVLAAESDALVARVLGTFRKR